MSESARTLFATAIGDAEQTALLLDSSGAPLAGSYIDQNGRDISSEIGAAPDNGARARRNHETRNMHLRRPR